jgi:beta-lactamase regulating signal transducer with metallopeptidase domain
MKARLMFEWLVLHTGALLVLIGIVLALGRGLRLGPAARHALWLVVLVKFLAPPLIYWPWALPAPAATTAPAIPLAAPPPPAGPDAPELRPPVGQVRVRIVELPPEEGEVTPTVSEGGPPPSWGWREALLLVWLGGALVVGGGQVVQVMRVRRLVRQGLPAPAWLEERIAELAAELRVAPPRALVLPGLGSPLIWAFGRPCLLWPAGLEDDLSEEGRRAVLIHELAHLRRRDHWVGWLLLAGACVWWWHPLYRLMRRELGRESELACDAWVVTMLPEARRAFAEALLEVCERKAPVAAPAIGVAGRRRDLERRLKMVMREQVSCRVSWCAALGVVLLALIALPAWSVGQMAKSPPGGVGPAVDGLLPVAQEKVPAAAKDTAARDKKLEELETKVAALLKELKELRKSGRLSEAAHVEKAMFKLWTEAVQARGGTTTVVGPRGGDVKAPPPVSVEVVLVRTTYTLPAAKGEALAKFLRENVKASVMEAKADGDRLIVTTTPEAQRAIGQFVLLIQGRLPAARHGGMWMGGPMMPDGSNRFDAPTKR